MTRGAAPLIVAIAAFVLAAAGFAAGVATVIARAEPVWIGLAILAFVAGEVATVIVGVLAIVRLVRGPERLLAGMTLGVVLLTVVGTLIALAVLAVVGSAIIVSGLAVITGWLSVLAFGTITQR